MEGAAAGADVAAVPHPTADGALVLRAAVAADGDLRSALGGRGGGRPLARGLHVGGPQRLLRTPYLMRISNGGRHTGFP